MSLLQGDERDQLIKLLLKLPNISDTAIRRLLGVTIKGNNLSTPIVAVAAQPKVQAALGT